MIIILIIIIIMIIFITMSIIEIHKMVEKIDNIMICISLLYYTYYGSPSVLLIQILWKT